VVWGTPELIDVERVVLQLQCRFDKTHERLLYVSRVPVGSPAPTPEVRRLLSSRMDVFLRLCAGFYIILEGDGFSSAVKRAVLTSLFFVTLGRGTLHVYSTTDELRANVTEEWRSEVGRLLSLAGQEDLLVGQIPSERHTDESGNFLVNRERAQRGKDSNVA
jgi:hypothetical protein